ncbi:MAG: hypothetical protein AAFO78_02650 [Pseudomonadota bacterium]
MFRRAFVASLAFVSLFLMSEALAGVSQNISIAAGKSLILGGDQSGEIRFNGQNRGETTLNIAVRSADMSRSVAALAPGERFAQSLAKGEVLVIMNSSATRAGDVYWHVGSQRDKPNPRFEPAQ